jgi:hypothetical protein
VELRTLPERNLYVYKEVVEKYSAKEPGALSSMICLKLLRMAKLMLCLLGIQTAWRQFRRRRKDYLFLDRA